VDVLPNADRSTAKSRRGYLFEFALEPITSGHLYDLHRLALLVSTVPPIITFLARSRFNLMSDYWCPPSLDPANETKALHFCKYEKTINRLFEALGSFSPFNAAHKELHKVQKRLAQSLRFLRVLITVQPSQEDDGTTSARPITQSIPALFMTALQLQAFKQALDACSEVYFC